MNPRPKGQNEKINLSELRILIDELRDRLHNGIKYNQVTNAYEVVWTQRELDQARNHADEICEALGIPL